MLMFARCARCGARLLGPVAGDGPAFCSDECRALHDDPDLLAHLAAEGPPPGRVRLHAAAWLVVSLAVSGVLLSFPTLRRLAPALLTGVLLLPVVFLAELITGRSTWQMNVWYRTLTLTGRLAVALVLFVVVVTAVLLVAWLAGGLDAR